MKVFVSAVDFDLSGYAAIDALPGSSFGEYIPRYSKTKTLDGGVAVYDGGWSAGDMKFTVRFKGTRALDAVCKRLVEYHSRVNVSTRDGVFRAVPEYDEGSEREARLSLSIVERLT